MDLNPMKFADFAKMAADNFLEKNTPLNETIAKFADKNNLTPIQIQRVVELANLETNDRMFKVAKDKTFTFPLATLPGVQALLSPEKQQTVKTAAFMDVLWPGKSQERIAEVTGELAKIAAPAEREMLEKRADLAAGALLSEVRKRAMAGLDKLAQQQIEAERAYEKIYNEAKNYIMLDGGKLQDMMKFACAAFPEGSRMWRVIFENIKNDLMKLGHPVDKALIDEKIEIPGSPVEVINGRHALQVDLDTLRRKLSETDKTRSLWVSALGDAPNPTPVGTTSFQDSDDVQLYLMSQVENLAKKASVMSDEGFLSEIHRLRGLAKEAAAKAKIQKKSLASRGLGWLGQTAGQHPYATLAALLLGPSLISSLGRGFGQAFGRIGRQPWSAQEAISGPQMMSTGMTPFQHTGYAGFSPQF